MATIRIGLNEHTKEAFIFCKYGPDSSVESDVFRLLERMLREGNVLEIERGYGSEITGNGITKSFRIQVKKPKP